MQSPTLAHYGDFQAAFEHFNLDLFGGDLPDVLFTLSRSRHTNGHIIPEGFSPLADGEGKRIAEISLNPVAFRNRTAEQVLSTLVHEMVHYYQHLAGKPGANGHHNKEWGTFMKKVGLYPSNTGKPGGAETGVKMTHYTIEGGPFQIAARELLDKGWALHYFAPGELGEPVKPATNSKTKQTCPHCRANAWAKPGLELYCGNGHEPRRMVTVGEA